MDIPYLPFCWWVPKLHSRARHRSDQLLLEVYEFRRSAAHSGVPCTLQNTTTSKSRS